MNKFHAMFLIVSAMFLASCSQSISQQEAELFFTECAKKAFYESNWLSFEVTEYRFSCYGENDIRDTLFVYHQSTVCYFKDEYSPEYYMGYDTPRKYKLLGDTLFLVNTQDNELGVFDRLAENAFVYPTYKWTIEKQAGYVPNYYASIFPSLAPTEKITIESMIDTIVDNVSYYLFNGISNISYLCDEETGDCDIPIQYHCSYWINKANFQLDSLFVYKEDTIHSPYTNKIAFTVKNVCHQDKSSYFDSIFNFNNQYYEQFSRHDDSFLPFSMGGRNPKLMTKTLLDYPLVNLNNDTITIADCKGWVLLSFWSFNCPSCIKNMQNYCQEQDSLGYRILEKEGISILSINYQSGNMDLIYKIAKETGTIDITYSAQGIMNLIKLPFLGYYYLISPDKETIYETSQLGDYSELLKAKADYEKQHQKE